MKTILFGIAMEGLDATKAKNFELKTMSALKSGSREFADAVSVHCDYKEGLSKICRQYLPDCIIINEELPGNGNIFDLIKDLKSDFPSIVFTVLLKTHRPVGDADLANLTAAGIYNWVDAPWTAEAIANSLISPRKMKDVEMYLPTFKQGSNGLVFDVKEVEKAQEKLEDLDVLASGTNNAVKTNKIVDDLKDKSTPKTSPYRKIISGGFGFGKKFKPVQTTEEVKEETTPTAPVSFEPSASDSSDYSLDSHEEEKHEEKMSLLEAIKKARAAAEAENKEKENEEVKNETEVTEEKTTETETTKTGSEISTKETETKDNSDEFVPDDEFTIENKETSEETKSEIKEEIKPETKEEINKENRTEENTDNSSEFVQEESTEVENTKTEETKKVEEVKTKESKKKEKPIPTATLSTIKFEPKFKKVLFIRALPISSVVPAHVAKLSNAAFVDFNKKSNNDGYFDLLRTTIKKAEMPEAEYVIGDVVAGNGVENLVGKFDHVIAILPEDEFEIKDFVERYKGLYDGVIIDKATTSALTRKQLLTLVPDAKYIDTIKTDSCNKEVVQSAINHEFLMDNPLFAEGMHFFLKDIGGVQWI